MNLTVRCCSIWRRVAQGRTHAIRLVRNSLRPQRCEDWGFEMSTLIHVRAAERAERVRKMRSITQADYNQL